MITNLARIFKLLKFFSFISDQILVILRNRDKSRPQYYSPEQNASPSQGTSSLIISCGTSFYNWAETDRVK